MSEETTHQQAVRARDAILSRKGIDPVVLDVRSVSSVADYFVMATGRNPPHLKALAAEVGKRAVESGRRRARRTGTPESGWIVLDYLGVVVHLFAPERRAYYALEELWNDAPRIG